MKIKVNLILENSDLSVRFLNQCLVLQIDSVEELMKINQLPDKLKRKLGFGKYSSEELRLLCIKIKQMDENDSEILSIINTYKS